MLGAALEYAGDRAGAQRAYGESLRLYPGDREAREGLAAVSEPAAARPWPCVPRPNARLGPRV